MALAQVLHIAAEEIVLVGEEEQDDNDDARELVFLRREFISGSGLWNWQVFEVVLLLLVTTYTIWRLSLAQLISHLPRRVTIEGGRSVGVSLIGSLLSTF